MNDITLKLEQLGFSSYEAKAYYALIRKHPANGYEIGKIGKIPSAKIYETLHRLVVKGAIVESGTDSGRYYPVPPETLLAKIQEQFTTMIQQLEASLKETEPVPDMEVNLNFSGYDHFLARAAKVIQQASSSLLLSLWPEEGFLLNDWLAGADKRGVRVIAGIFGKPVIDAGYYVNLESCGVSSHARLAKQLNVVIGDDKEVVIGEVDSNGQTEGVWTTTGSIVLIAKEYIKHDMWGHALIAALGESRFRQLCADNPVLSYLIKKR
ncbi:TrmB family transcriptional regulator [Propionispora hippei]|uniref:Sugar-specific transcriptional regulator TrmB n=1 Tax=Propionispora hippei DSM 15287 TaxID=1123003 RepID=A0A1M6BZK2_9FIRM|nr:TrmB family transcriptional regulator [Propionispora hippei]SHI54177.1 Sugar-specific transcriptional regulator TrmB [Propionispora hippei DSM 15287]